jgi:hypothetical protein
VVNSGYRPGLTHRRKTGTAFGQVRMCCSMPACVLSTINSKRRSRLTQMGDSGPFPDDVPLADALEQQRPAAPQLSPPTSKPSTSTSGCRPKTAIRRWKAMRQTGRNSTRSSKLMTRTRSVKSEVAARAAAMGYCSDQLNGVQEATRVKDKALTDRGVTLMSTTDGIDSSTPVSS